MQRRQRFTQKQTLEERLIEQATRLRAEANALPLGAAREAIISRAEQAEAGVHMCQWLSLPSVKAGS